jgi:sporulation protein YlmC with PRC-barrel domain
MAKDRDIRRDMAGVGPDPSESRRRLMSIDDLDGFTIAKGEPDIRGWDVTTLNGRELGQVEDLLVDPDHGEVVMVEVALRGDQLHAEVPIRSVQLDRKRNVVIVDSGDVEGRMQDPVRARDRMDAEERERMRGTYAGTSGDVRYDTTWDEDTEREERRRRDEQRAERRRDEEERDARRSDNDDVLEETVVERRPVIEEVVVRRRTIEE